METESFVGAMAVLALFASFVRYRHMPSASHYFPGESCVNRSPNIALYYFSGAIGIRPLRNGCTWTPYG